MSTPGRSTFDPDPDQELDNNDQNYDNTKLNHQKHVGTGTVTNLSNRHNFKLT